MKYKLIKEYPGSPKLNTIVENHEKVNSANTLDKRYYYNGMKIQDYPEFWEEVVEKDYEILSVITNNGKFIEKVYNQDATIEPYWRINSIKRLSDGEIFTIGDKVEHKNIKEYGSGIIKEFLLQDTLYLYNLSTNNGNYGLPYNMAIKSKQPLFTTEDGVDIFEDCEVYQIDNNFTVFYYISWKNYYGDNGIPKPGYKWFSTKEKAEEYILMNKPCLSLNDIFKDVEKMRKGLKTFENSELGKRFKKLVQQKLNK